MKVTWIGHSCFAIEKDGAVLVVDPYVAKSVPGLSPVALEAQQVLCSHEHGDHNGRAEVKLAENKAQWPFTVEALQTWHDEVNGAKRGKNQIFIISDGAQRIAHLGDLGCELTDEQMEQLKNLDAVMVPVGGYYTIDGKQAAALIKRLDPRIVIPMHYRDDQAGFGFSEIGTVDEFTRYMDRVTTVSASEVETEDQMSAQVVVLQPMRAQKLK